MGETRLLGGFERKVCFLDVRMLFIVFNLEVSPHLISVRLNENRKRKGREEIRRVAYLLDVHTISVG